VAKTQVSSSSLSIDRNEQLLIYKDLHVTDCNMEEIAKDFIAANTVPLNFMFTATL